MTVELIVNSAATPAVEAAANPAQPADAVADARGAQEEAKPPKITTLTLCDFRAFAGPEPVTFHLDGKNLLIYGENGAGKSSVYHALDGFFSGPEVPRSDRLSRIKKNKNVFSKQPDDNAWVGVTFDGASDMTIWNNRYHPTDSDISSRDDRVVGASKSKAILDYKSLLETNFVHRDLEVNLFDLCVRSVLRDYPVSHNGQDDDLLNLWSAIKSEAKADATLPTRKLGKKQLANVNQWTADFNLAIRTALDQLTPEINKFLGLLKQGNLELKGWQLPGVTYDPIGSRRGHYFDGCILSPEVEFNGWPLTAPQTFLNEARLTALGLAIYFAGRKICAATLQSGTPRIMVLDDVLIGMDQSNRLPVIDILADEFSDWQIVLLTHDRTWFEIARTYQRRHTADKYWNYVRIHSEDDPARAPSVMSVSSSAASDAVQTAERFLREGHLNAAANYSRIAAETALREYCEFRKLPIVYRQQPDKTPFSELISAAKASSAANNGGKYDAVLASIEEFTNILLNPLSHGGVNNLTAHEVHRAIVEVEKLLFSLKVAPYGAKPMFS